MAPNTPGNNSENNTENAENQSKDSGSIISQLYKDFAKSLVNKEGLTAKQKTDNVNHFMNLDSLSEIDLKKIVDFKGNDSKGTFDTIKSSDIELSPIKRELQKEFFKRKSLFQSMKKSILREYDITSAQYSDLNIEDEIKGLALDDISKYIESSSEMDKFISGFCIKKRRDIFNKRNISGEWEKYALKGNYIDKINMLPENKQKEVKIAIQNLMEIDFTDGNLPTHFSECLESLLNNNVINNSEITDLLQIYTPYVSGKIALQINPNLDEKELKRQEFLQLEDINFGELDESVQNKLIDKLDINDIFLPIEYLFTLPKNGGIHNLSIQKIIEVGLLKKIGEDVQENLIKEEDKNGPTTYLTFINKLKEQNEKIKNPEQFKKGNYIILTKNIKTQENPNGEDIKEFFQIVSDGSQKPRGGITLASMGQGKYSTNNVKNTTRNFKVWSDFFEKGNPEKGVSISSLEIYSEKVFKDKVKNGEVEEDNDTTNFKTQQDIEAAKNFKKQEKIKKLLEEYPEYENLNEAEIEEKLNEEYPDFNEKLEKEYVEWNKTYLITKLKDLDNAGNKFGFDTGTTVSYLDENRKTQYFSIHQTLSESIHIMHPGGHIEELDFITFYESFKSQKAKRINKTENKEKLLDNIGSTELGEKYWEGITISDSGTFVKKNTTKNSESEEEIEYEYIEGENNFIDNCNIIKVHEIKDGYAEISFGKKTGHEKLEDEEEQKKKEEREKKEGKKITYKMHSNTEKIPLGILQEYINKAGGIPKSFAEENSPEVHSDPESVEREGSFMSRFMQRFSINDLLASGKLLADSVESMLSEGTDEQAAKLLSKLKLPQAIQVDVQMRVEQASKKRMDEFKDRLGGMDSGIATKMIEKVLLNKDAPESMKEACIMFMAEKYGTLYEKEALHKHKGKFLRYEAFGGRIGDEMYRKVEASCKKDDVNFTEHELMISMLGAQCKGHRDPRRRSKLHKEYKAAMAGGKKDEQEKGKKDADEKRTFHGRLYGVALDELKDGAYLNAIGALGPVIGKGDGGNLTSINMLPFVMMASGDAYTYDQDISNTIKGSFSPVGMPLPATFFCSSPSLIELYNNTLIKATEILAKDNPSKYGKMLEDVSGLISGNKKVLNDKNQKVEKIDEAIKVYEKYGDEISRIMNMLNSRKNDDISKYEKLIYLEKDNEPIFKKYYSLFTDVAVGSECEFGKDNDTMADAYYSGDQPGTGGYTGMGEKKVYKDMLAEHAAGTYRMDKAASMVENEFVKQLDAFHTVDYNYGNSDIETANKRKLNVVTKHIHGFLFGAIYHHRDTIKLGRYIETNVPMRTLQAKIEDFKGLTATDFENDTEETLALSKKYAERWLGMRNTHSEYEPFSDIPETIDNTRNAANDAFNNHSQAA